MYRGGSSPSAYPCVAGDVWSDTAGLEKKGLEVVHRELQPWAVLVVTSVNATKPCFSCMDIFSCPWYIKPTGDQELNRSHSACGWGPQQDISRTSAG